MAKRSNIWIAAGESVPAIELSPVEENIFSRAFSMYSKKGSDDPNSIFYAPTFSVQERERIGKASLGFFLKHFNSTYPKEVIIDAIAVAASLPISALSQCVESFPFKLGVAIWLLDYAEAFGISNEFHEILPEEVPDTDCLIENIEDGMHSRHSILRVVNVLNNRKGNKKKEFRKILSLIDPHTVNSMRMQFKNCFIDYTDRYLEICSRVKPIRPSNAVSSTITRPHTDLSLGFYSAKMDGNVIQTAPDIFFLLMTPVLIGKSTDCLKKILFYRRSVNLIEGFCIKDPYVICAAYMLLEQENDMLALMGALTNTVTSIAIRYLPWFANCPDCPNMSDFGTSEYELRHKISVGSEETWCSEAQVFFSATDYVLPRNVVPSKQLVQWFIQQGLSEERAQALAFGAMLVSQQGNYKNAAELFSILDEHMEDREEIKKEEDNLECANKTRIDLQNAQQIEKLTQQIKELHKALYDSSQMEKQLQKQLLEKEKQSAQEHMELIRLRNVLYAMKSGEENCVQSAETEEISLPYQSERRILIFGGHETWIKAIRPLLPSVRFVEKNMLDTNIIKGADAIWIQTNAISHAFFYRIIHCARKENIPVHYFGFSGAKKCAEQLVLDELDELAETNLTENR